MKDRVIHVSLHKSINVYNGTAAFPLKRMVFDGPEGCPGIRMSLCPAGVLCALGKNRFIIPFAACESVSLASEEK